MSHPLATSSRLTGASLLIGIGLLALAGWGQAPASTSGRAARALQEPPAPAGHAAHAMSQAAMAAWVHDWYANHPARGERSLDVAADTFFVTDYRFDADGSAATQIDTVRIVAGQTVMWRWLFDSHTTTSGDGLTDPNAGLLWDHPISATDTEFTYRFDSVGVYPFFCRPHFFFDMRGVVVVSEPSGPDLIPPQVTVVSPDGGAILAAHQPFDVTWQATDAFGVTAVDVFYRDAETAPWVTLARGLANAGSFTWYVHDTPSPAARVRVVARDAAGNAGEDSSHTPFVISRVPGGRVPTTLRDFLQPGTQPLDGGAFLSSEVCLSCHGGYQSDVEPGAWKGTMMSQSGRDPLFYACLAVAEQDAPSSGDLCIRCHASTGWLSGRSVPTDGSRLTAADRDGVSCNLCHRMVDPIPRPGVNPPQDANILGALLPAHRPTGYANGQYVIDPDRDMRRGPYTYTAAPHPFLQSDFHRRGDLCGTCHDVSNPVFARVAGADYAPGPLDQRADSLGVEWLMPIERTFSEWRASDYPAGVYAPEFAGNKPFGVVSTCQDCHERQVLGRGCNPDSFPNAPLRTDLPFHDMTGGNAWMPMALLGLAGLYPGEIDPDAQARVAARATAMLQKAAVLDLRVDAAGDSLVAVVTVTNRTGHKLPTGYPEGRRMWLEVRARDASGAVVYRSGAYDPATATLASDPDAVVYEAHLGLSPAWAGALGLAAGPSFHFVLNDTVYKDNRIPPRGFRNATFATFGGTPVDDARPAPRYPDAQYWDTSRFRLPASTRSVAVALRYQSTAKEYVEFLRDENYTNGAGDTLYALWSAHGKSEPVVMAYDSVTVTPLPLPTRSALRALTNPFRGALRLELSLPRPEPVLLEVFDLGGRRLCSRDYGVLGGGAHVLTWDGLDRHGTRAGSGSFWARVHAGSATLRQKVIRLE